MFYIAWVDLQRDCQSNPVRNYQINQRHKKFLSAQTQNLVILQFKIVRNLKPKRCCAHFKRSHDAAQKKKNHYLFVPIEGGKCKTYQSLNFSVHFWKFWLRQGGLPFYRASQGKHGRGDRSKDLLTSCIKSITNSKHTDIWITSGQTEALNTTSISYFYFLHRQNTKELERWNILNSLITW